MNIWNLIKTNTKPSIKTLTLFITLHYTAMPCQHFPKFQVIRISSFPHEIPLSTYQPTVQPQTNESIPRPNNQQQNLTFLFFSIYVLYTLLLINVQHDDVEWDDRKHSSKRASTTHTRIRTKWDRAFHS